MAKIPVSAIVMTKDEEANIGKCLEQLWRFGEVFVVDSGSTDRTREIAASHSATVVDFAWNGAYPKKKQWSLENLPLSFDWVLYVDADEEVTPELAAEIARRTELESNVGYLVGYDYVFMDRVLTHGHLVYKLVLFRHGHGRFDPYNDLEASNMWEVEGHYQPSIDGTISILKHRMVHHDAESLFHYFDRHNRYSDWEAVVRTGGAGVRGVESQPLMRRLMKVAFNRAPMKGVLAFLHSYVAKRGFLDGRAGFHFAVARGFYYWQTGLKISERRRRSRGPAV